METLWCFYDISIGISQGMSMVILWDSYGFSKECLWDFYDVSMGFLWASYGVSMIVLWYVYGITMGCQLKVSWNQLKINSN